MGQLFLERCLPASGANTRIADEPLILPGNLAGKNRGTCRSSLILVNVTHRRRAEFIRHGGSQPGGAYRIFNLGAGNVDRDNPDCCDERWI